MKLSFLFELLMFFVILSFAASRTVVQNRQEIEAATIAPVISTAVEVITEAAAPAIAEAVTAASAAVAEVTEEVTTEATGLSRFCKCATLECNCCREFKLPVLPISSSGCASLRYLKGDKMALTMRVGDVVLSNTTISGKKNKPACVNLPGGFSQFCGRVYGISRQGNDFKACLALELRALADLEASLRVSCFRFTPKGVKLEAAPPLPPSNVDEEEDDDDFFGLGFGAAGDDESAEEEDEDDTLADAEEEEEEEEDEYAEADSADNDVAAADTDADYTGFSALGTTFGDFFGGFFESSPSSGTKKKKKPVVENSLRPAKPLADDKIDINIDEIISSAKPMPVKPTVSTITLTTEKPIKSETLTTFIPKPVKIVTTTEREPTTIVLSPTSSVKVTTTQSTTQRSKIPDPVKPTSESAEESVEEVDSEEEPDSEETTDKTSEDNETFSSELAEAIKGVEEELSSVADIVDEPEAESGEEESAEESAEDSEESTGPPSAAVEISSTTPADDDELDILEEVEQLALEVSSADEKEDKPPRIGVPINGEPRATTKQPPAVVSSSVRKDANTVLKRTHRVSRHHNNK